MQFQRDNEFVELDPMGLREASGYVFYNTSDWPLKKLVETATNNRQILEANFKAYLDGFSASVQEIIDKFGLRSGVQNPEFKQAFNASIVRLLLDTKGLLGGISQKEETNAPT